MRQFILGISELVFLFGGAIEAWLGDWVVAVAGLVLACYMRLLSIDERG